MNYSKYKKDYLKSNPGEHHIVAVYLLPLIKRLAGLYPTFVNPDGMKKVKGDLIYKVDEKEIGIEVKWKKLQLTAVQMALDTKDPPDYLVYFSGENKIGIAEWKVFIKKYDECKERREKRMKERGKKPPFYSKYGPAISDDDLEKVGITIVSECDFKKILIKWLV